MEQLSIYHPPGKRIADFHGHVIVNGQTGQQIESWPTQTQADRACKEINNFEASEGRPRVYIVKQREVPSTVRVIPVEPRKTSVTFTPPTSTEIRRNAARDDMDRALAGVGTYADAVTAAARAHRKD